MQVFNRWCSQQTNVVPHFIHYAFFGGENFNLFFPSGKIPLHEVNWKLMFNEGSWRCFSVWLNCQEFGGNCGREEAIPRADCGCSWTGGKVLGHKITELI